MFPALTRERFVASFITLCLYSCEARSHSPLGHEAVLVIVTVELVIAFTVGILCIIFSCNVLRAITDYSEDALPPGSLPPSRSHLILQKVVSSNRMFPLAILNNDNIKNSYPDEADELEFDTESNTDVERRGFFAIVRAFTEYLRIW